MNAKHYISIGLIFIVLISYLMMDFPSELESAPIEEDSMEETGSYDELEQGQEERPEEYVEGEPEGVREKGDLVNVNFTVHIPIDTPNETIYLVVNAFNDHTLKRIKMTRKGDVLYASMQISRGLHRYRYERGDAEKREKFDDETDIHFRYLLVLGEDLVIEDTIAGWRDIETIEPKRGKIAGIVRDASTKKGIMDATVSIAGRHIATDYAGKFELEVPVGVQRITISTPLGDYKYASKEVRVEEGQTTFVDFELEPAKKVNVTFRVKVREVPPHATVRIIGSIYQLGCVRWHENHLSPWRMREIFMNKTDEGFEATIELYEGTYVEYLYTLGDDANGYETNPNGYPIIRSFIVEGSDMLIEETIGMWRPGGWVSVTFNVEVPENTPEEDQVLFKIAWGIPMNKMAKNRWTLTLFMSPNSSISYSYVHGWPNHGLDVRGRRELFVSDEDLIVNDTVERWMWFPAGEVEVNYTIEPFQVKKRGFFMAGVAVPDYYSPDHLLLLPSSLDHMKENNIVWVNIPQIWYLRQLNPPMIDGRWYPQTPTADIIREIEEIHSRGMKVLLYPGLIPEDVVYPGCIDKLDFPKTDEWYEGLYGEYRKFMLYNAVIANKTGTDALFICTSWFYFLDDAHKGFANEKMKELISEIREIYDGFLISPYHDGYDFYDEIDFIEITWWESLNVPNDASVSAMRLATERILDEKYKWIYEVTGKPIVVTQLNYVSVDGGANQARSLSTEDRDDPTVKLDLKEQAMAYEAFFQAINDRPWIVGVFSWAYTWIDSPQSKTSTIRAKPAEIVVSHYYAAFQGQEEIISDD